MPDHISRERLKKKVLDRWENEGGKISVEQTGKGNTGSRDKGGGGKDNSAKTSEGMTAKRPKRKE